MTTSDIALVKQLIDLELIRHPNTKRGTANEIRLFAQTIQRQNQSLSGLGIVLSDIESVIQQNYCTASPSGQMITVSNHIPWFNQFVTTHNMPFANAYMQYLYATGGSAMNAAKIDVETNEIMDQLVLPQPNVPFDVRGLVVGSVQSGKTSNYISLINKAADAGYKLIIVLSGMYNDLRRQTQLRVDKGFIGEDTGLEYGTSWANVTNVGQYRRNLPVHFLTTSQLDGDVDTDVAARNSFNPQDLTIAVCKKNVSCLDSLLNLLYKFPYDRDASGNPIIRDVPMLLIDDEADSASIDVSTDNATAPSTINSQIRSLLTLFEQSAYVGYTATPYSNILIDVNGNSPVHYQVVRSNGTAENFLIGDDLFPCTFIYNLNTPSSYLGPDSYFGANALPLHRSIDGDKVEAWLSDNVVNPMPDSLEKAVMSYLIATAVRRLRGDDQKHSSMLVHIDYHIDKMDFVATEVNSIVDGIKTALSVRMGMRSPYELAMMRLYNNDFAILTNGLTSSQMSRFGDVDMPYSWSDVLDEIDNVLQKVEVVAIHSDSPASSSPLLGKLDYNAYEGHAFAMDNGCYVIAVGGNCLSRGLTLEGLVVSYFHRNTVSYDTLMQMGRWFGYRPNYYDLCRLFVSDTVYDRFKQINEADSSLREDFRELMMLPGVTPESFRLSIKSTPDMNVTSAAKLGRGVVETNTDHDAVKQTKVMSIDPSIRQQRVDLVRNFIDVLGAESAPLAGNNSHMWWTNVPASKVADFVQGYNTPLLECQYVKLFDLFIRSESAKGNLTNWTVVLYNNGRNTCGEFDLNTALHSKKIQLILRDYDNSTSTNPNYYSRAKGITQGSDASLDAALKVAGRRPKTNGLLVIYPMNLSSDPSKPHFIESCPMFGYAAFLPEDLFPTTNYCFVYNDSL